MIKKKEKRKSETCRFTVIVLPINYRLPTSFFSLTARQANIVAPTPYACHCKFLYNPVALTRLRCILTSARGRGCTIYNAQVLYLAQFFADGYQNRSCVSSRIPKRFPSLSYSDKPRLKTPGRHSLTFLFGWGPKAIDQSGCAPLGNRPLSGCCSLAGCDPIFLTGDAVLA